MPAVSRFPTPDQTRLPHAARAVLARRAARLGFVPNFFLTFALRPRHLVRWAAHYDELMLSRSDLSVLDRELIAVAVSRANDCSYCLATHGARLRVLLGDPRQAARIARDFRQAGLDARTLAMLEFAVKVTRRQTACSARDLQRLHSLGFSDEACWDIIETAAMFNFTNRLANAAGMRPNPEYRRMGRGSRRVPSHKGLAPPG